MRVQAKQNVKLEKYKCNFFFLFKCQNHNKNIMKLYKKDCVMANLCKALLFL